MASYYHTHGNTTSTEVPDHGLHTLILMNPNLAHTHAHPHNSPNGGYDSHQQHQPPPSHNILLLNSAAAAAAFSHPPPSPHHQFVRLPAPQQDNITLYGYPQEDAREFSRARQGLSLSLSSQNPSFGHHQNGPEGVQADDGGGSGEGAGGQVSVMGSKYLRAAQELLEEVVHVGDHGLNLKSSTTDHESPKKGKGVGDSASEEKHHGGSSGGGSTQLSTAERQDIQMKKAKLATMLEEAEQRYRQYHNQMQIVIESFERAAGMGSAKTYTALALKTISKQFRCLKDAIQGQIKVANKTLGEEEGGSGSTPGKIEGSRLKFIDHQIRQQRALQQLGMIQNHNAWRPQRGLPERSVSVLRAWLFEHFLHPYPKDSDKIMLAKQTGLTRSQVSNWFINARVRLWKPMIEEMYNEELKERELNGSEEKASTKENSNDDGDGSNSITDHEKINIVEGQVKPCIQNNGHSSSTSFIHIPSSTATLYKGNNSMPQNQHGFTLNGSFDMEGISQASPKRQRSNEVPRYESSNGEILIKFGNEKQERDHGYPIISGGMNFLGGGELGSYPIGEIERFETEDFPPRFLQGNGISLSLGLPPSCDNHQQFNNLAATSHTFMSPNQNIQFRRGNDFDSMSSPSSHSSAAAFECIDIQNRKGFAAQLLPDFVA